MTDIPSEFHDLFEKATFAHLVTLAGDGMPHVTPVWVGYDADAGRLLVNTERHRKKAKNVERDPRVAASMTDPDNPYRYVSVRGEVEDITSEGAREHIDELAYRYMGEEEYPNPIESERIILRVRPDDVLTAEG